MLWIGGGESCSPQGAASGLIPNLLSSSLAIVGFSKARNSVSTFPFPSSPISLFVLWFVLGSGTLKHLFKQCGRQRCGQPVFVTRPGGFVPACGFSFLQGVYATAGLSAATLASWWDQAFLSALFSLPGVNTAALPLSKVLSSGQRWFCDEAAPRQVS